MLKRHKLHFIVQLYSKIPLNNMNNSNNNNSASKTHFSGTFCRGHLSIYPSVQLPVETLSNQTLGRQHQPTKDLCPSETRQNCPVTSAQTFYWTLFLTSHLCVCMSQGLLALCVRLTSMSVPAHPARMAQNAMTGPMGLSAAVLKVRASVQNSSQWILVSQPEMSS